MGRKITTGKFDTREELAHAVVVLMVREKMSFSQTAKKCQVSIGTVQNLLYDWQDNPHSSCKCGVRMTEAEGKIGKCMKCQGGK